MTTYSEKLRDPRWQRKRLEILDRDGFECGDCGSHEKTLHVHHGYYEKGRDPWDYPDESLHSLCEDCHGETEAMLARIRRFVGCVDPGALARLYGHLRGFDAEYEDPEGFDLGPAGLEVAHGLFLAIRPALDVGDFEAFTQDVAASDRFDPQSYRRFDTPPEWQKLRGLPK